MSDEPPTSILVEFLQDDADAQPMTVYCGFCPKWRADGTAAETREAAVEHRMEKHPETLLKKQVVRQRRVFSQALSAEREAEIEEQRRQRLRSLGMI